MSTKTQTNQSSSSALNYDPSSLSLYKNLTGAGGKVLSGYMNNPFGNPAYTMGLQQSVRGATQAGANNMQALTQRMKASGLTGQAGAGFLQAQGAQQGRANQSLLSQANIANVMAAMQRQLGATGMGMSYSPLMTGENSQGQSTTTKSGLGTWLPQLIGAGVSGLMAAGTGGASLAMGPAMSAVTGDMSGGSNPLGGYGMPTGDAAYGLGSLTSGGGFGIGGYGQGFPSAFAPPSAPNPLMFSGFGGF